VVWWRYEEMTTVPETITIHLTIPEDLPHDAREHTQREATVAGVLALWQRQHLTIREAAEELGLTYQEFLELLDQRGLPVERGPLDLTALEEARRSSGSRLGGC
jgi:predicted HTH domain antitoxin